MDEQPFAPIALTEAVTPQRVKKMIDKKRYGQALLLSLHLNDVDIVQEALEAVPVSKIMVVGNSLPPAFLQRLMECIAQSLGKTQHLEYYLRWVVTLLNGNGSLLRAQTPQFLRTMRALQKAILQHESDLQQMCDENQYMMKYGLTLAAKKKDIEDAKEVSPSR